MPTACGIKQIGFWRIHYGGKRMQEIRIAPDQAGQRFDKFLRRLFPEAGNGFLYKMLRKKNITLNGKKAEGKEILNPGDVVRMYFAQDTFLKLSHKSGVQENDRLPDRYREAYRKYSGVSILYEDERMLVLNKPVGLLTQKAKDGDLSLNEWMIGYLLDSGALSAEELRIFRPSVCNRLDRNTSGLVLCGKSLAGSQYLSELIRTRGIRKFYRTICAGSLTGSATIRGYLTKDTRANKVRLSQTDGEPVCTAYDPLRSNGHYTLLEVELITGKTHQIRAQLADMGHPLIGDFKYGDQTVNRRLKDRYGLDHHLLHAHRIRFPDGRELTAPCPREFERLEKALLDDAESIGTFV